MTGNNQDNFNAQARTLVTASIDLETDDVEAIVMQLVMGDEALIPLIEAIEEAQDKWAPSYRGKAVLEAVYRTRMRHLSKGEVPEERIAAFSRHLHVVSRLFQRKDEDFSRRLRVYELLLNDSLTEIQGDYFWTNDLDRVLRKTHLREVLSRLAVCSPSSAEVLTEGLCIMEYPLNTHNRLRVLGIMEAVGLVAPVSSEGGETLYRLTLLGRAKAAEIINEAVTPAPPEPV